MPPEISADSLIYINKVHFKGYKSIEDLAIDFKNGLNILIGKNGSGKSNFMEFMFQTIRYARNQGNLFKYAKLEFISGDKHLFAIEYEKEMNVNTEKENIDDRIVLLEKFSIDNKIVFNNVGNEENKRKFEFKNESHIYRGTLRALLRSLDYDFTYPLYIRFNLPANLECISVPGTLKIDLESPAFLWDYPNTLSFVEQTLFGIEDLYRENTSDKLQVLTQSNLIEYLKVDDELLEGLMRFTAIQEVRFNNNINIYNDGKRIIIENIKIDFKINDNWMPWSQLSDGTKRLFYIISEVIYNNGLILIEEPELGIHPHQFNLIMDFLKEQSESKQIIISTHSPKALDHLTPDELDSILITYFDLKRGTQIRHLTSKEIIKAKKYMKEVGFFSDYWMLSDLEE